MFGPYSCKTLPFRGTPRRDLGARPSSVGVRTGGLDGQSATGEVRWGGGGRLADAVGELDGGEIEGRRRRHHPRDVAPTPGARTMDATGKSKTGEKTTEVNTT